jgi:hypothetical protein
MGLTRPNDAPAQARPQVVAYSARLAQRTLDLQAHQDSVPSRRLKWLRMGSRDGRQPCLPSTRFLVRRRPPPTHHVEGAPSRVPRDRVIFTTATRTRREVLLHEDNTAVVATLSKRTTRSPVMRSELRRLWHLLDVNDIRIRPKYIRSAANIWADSLSRELDRDD